MPNLLCESKTPITSSKRKSVFLREWWLIKVDAESQLGVGGFVNRETLRTRGMRLLGSASTGKSQSHSNVEDGIQVYGSAAIAKRHDNNTLEAVDGVIILISGCINKSRTLSHGFSPEVCDGFLSGFPCNWEDYASKSFHDKCSNTTNQSLPVSFDDLPITRVRDLLMSQTESRAAMSIIFRDILKHTENIIHQNVPSTEKNSVETEIDDKQDDVVSLSNDLNSTKKITEEGSKIPADSHEDGGFMSGKVCKKKKTKEKRLKELPRRYQLRSMRKRKRT
ncbi:kinetochore-associated protein KNL-2 homolog [Bidens hawaiensis]|uniref:kinetochore-associated protein KNL-2 homolog n=1 Tax=Bidens hawaiensis TaxID=980011 RepID=UPI00404A9EA9